MRCSKTILVGLLWLGLTADVSVARTGFASRVASPATAGFLDPVRNLLVKIWGRIGCEIDPLGRCLAKQDPAAPISLPTPHSTNGDFGCQVDPLGGCIARH